MNGYDIDISGLRGLKVMRGEQPGLATLDGRLSLTAKPPQRALLEAVAQGAPSFRGNLRDHAYVQFALFHFRRLGKLSRAIDFDEVLALNGPPARPFAVSFVTTKLCNLRCVHCYNDSGLRDSDELLRTAKIQLVDELGRWGVSRLILTGGEPLIDPALPEILNLARQHVMKVKVTTNGWRLPDVLLAHIARGVVEQVNVSVDGADAATHDRFRQRKGSYERALQALAVLSTSGLRNVVMNCAIHPAALGQMEELTKIAIKFRCCAISFKPVLRTGRSWSLTGSLLDENDLHAFERERGRLRRIYGQALEIDGKLIAAGVPEDLLESVACNAGTSAMMIDADGRMLPCEVLSDGVQAPRVSEYSPVQAWLNHPLFSRFRTVKASGPKGGCGTAGCPGCRLRPQLTDTVS